MDCIIPETGQRFRLLLVGTDCAKSVGGIEWAKQFTQRYFLIYSYKIEWIAEDEPFRFGLGPLVKSRYAVIIPLLWHSARVLIRFSVVDKDVPPPVAKDMTMFLKLAEAHKPTSAS